MMQDNMPDSPFEKIPPELWLILASAGSDIDKTQDLLLQPINWDLFLQLAVYHRVYPLVYKTLSQLNNPAVPGYVLDLLKQKYQGNTLQALNMTGETVRIIKCFESHGINAVVLKGAPLAWRLYGDIAIRPSRDIDILVSPDELEKVSGILEEEGYLKTQPEYPEYNLTSRQYQIISKAHQHSFHVGYLHKKKNIYLEIHWKHGAHVLPLPTGSNINRIKVAGSPLPVHSDEEWLLFLMLHGARHGWFRLRWLVDIAKFVQLGGINWGKMKLMAERNSVQSILHQSLILANRLLAVPVPTNLQSAVEHDQSAWRLACMAINLRLSDADHEINGSNSRHINYRRMIYDYQVRVGWKSRFNYVSKYLRPTVYDIKLIVLPDRLYPLYYVIRPFTFLGRRLRRLWARS